MQIVERLSPHFPEPAVSKVLCERRQFYTDKPVRSWLGTPGNFPVLPVQNQGGKKPRRHGASFLGSLEKGGLSTESRPVQNNLHTMNVFTFYDSRDSHSRMCTYLSVGYKCDSLFSSAKTPHILYFADHLFFIPTNVL